MPLVLTEMWDESLLAGRRGEAEEAEEENWGILNYGRPIQGSLN